MIYHVVWILILKWLLATILPFHPNWLIRLLPKPNQTNSINANLQWFWLPKFDTLQFLCGICQKVWYVTSVVSSSCDSGLRHPLFIWKASSEPRDLACTSRKATIPTKLTNIFPNYLLIEEKNYFLCTDLRRNILFWLQCYIHTMYINIIAEVLSIFSCLIRHIRHIRHINMPYILPSWPSLYTLPMKKVGQ